MASSKKQGAEPDQSASPLRDPSEWKTGDEPITAAQLSYLTTLATEAGEKIDDPHSLSKAEAAMKIDELQQKTGRGQSRSA